MPWTSLCSLDELQEGKAKYVEIDGHQLAVYLHQGKPYVIDNYCPHAGGNLAGGFVEDGCAVCPWDCGTADGVVDVVDFLALLQQWAQVGSACDVNGGGVSTTDFLGLLANWGPCPG